MAAQTFVIEKKKYSTIPENEYLQFKEDLLDMAIFIKYKNEKWINAREFFDKVLKK